MPRVLLATCASLPTGDEDASLLESALLAQGVQPVWASWDDPAVDWTDDLVVVRSTWDYTSRREQFLAWAAGVPRLANPAGLVRWSSDKSYLADLVAAGLPTVPTVVAGPGAETSLPDAAEIVVKPSIGAGSRGAGRFAGDAGGRSLARRHIDALRAAGYTALVQPYLSDVDTRGETALVFLAGRFSHAIRKAPLLTPDASHPLHRGPRTELFVPETISARVAEDAEIALGRRVLTFVRKRFGDEPLYARVDLLPTSAGPVVIELELVEPSLFLSFAEPEALNAFAGDIAAAA